MDLRQGGPGVDNRHRGSNSHPTVAKYLGNLHPFGHSRKSTPHWSEGAISIGGEAPLHSHCPTPTKSHKWAIPVRLGNNTGQNVLVIKDGSHFQIQSRMQLCIPLYTGVRKICLPYQIT